jgi:hypothetical protein
MQKFEEIWQRAERVNKQTQSERFYRMYEQRRGFATVGIYDSVTKRYALFDTVNLTGNFRYDNYTIPAEIKDMEKMVSAAG